MMGIIFGTYVLFVNLTHQLQHIKYEKNNLPYSNHRF